MGGCQYERIERNRVSKRVSYVQPIFTFFILISAFRFMSNRGRQNVASFLSKDLGLDWRLGAEWFESQLIDHDVCSNYGNWQYGI